MLGIHCANSYSCLSIDPPMLLVGYSHTLTHVRLKTFTQIVCKIVFIRLTRAPGEQALVLVRSTRAVSSEPSAGCSAKYLSMPCSRAQGERPATMEEEGCKWIHPQWWAGLLLSGGRGWIEVLLSFLSHAK